MRFLGQRSRKRPPGASRRPPQTAPAPCSLRPSVTGIPPAPLPRPAALPAAFFAPGGTPMDRRVTRHDIGGIPGDICGMPKYMNVTATNRNGMPNYMTGTATNRCGMPNYMTGTATNRIGMQNYISGMTNDSAGMPTDRCGTRKYMNGMATNIRGTPNYATGTATNPTAQPPETRAAPGKTHETPTFAAQTAVNTLSPLSPRQVSGLPVNRPLERRRPRRLVAQDVAGRTPPLPGSWPPGAVRARFSLPIPAKFPDRREKPFWRWPHWANARNKTTQTQN